MLIETVLFIAFVVSVGAAIVKAYERSQDVLHGPVHEAGRLKSEATIDSHQLHPWIEPTPRNNKAWHYIRSSFRDAQFQPALCADRFGGVTTPVIGCTKNYRVAVGVASDRDVGYCGHR